MKPEKFDILADRVRSGEPLAACEFQSALELPLARIVRRALRPGTSPDPMVRRIRQEVGHLANRRDEPEAVRQLNDAIVGQLRYGRPARTLARETVVA